MKHSKGLILVLVSLLIGVGLVALSIWGEAKRKELAYDVFSTLDQVKESLKKQEADHEKINDLEQKLIDQLATIENLKGEIEKLKVLKTTENFAPLDTFNALNLRVEKLEKNNTTEKTKQILSLYTMASLRRALEDERGFVGELTALKKLYPTWTQWEVLSKYATTGIPSFSTLKTSFYDLMKQGEVKSETTPDATFQNIKEWGAIFLSKAQNLIRIEKTNLRPENQTPQDILKLTGRALEDNNLTEALNSMARLEISSPSFYARFKDWHGKAVDRVVLLKMADDLMMKLTLEIQE